MGLKDANPNQNHEGYAKHRTSLVICKMSKIENNELFLCRVSANQTSWYVLFVASVSLLSKGWTTVVFYR